MGRSEAEAGARQVIEDNNCGMPLGSAVVRKDRPDKEHYLIRFPNEIVADAEIDAGERLAQFYDKEAGELRIPVE